VLWNESSPVWPRPGPDCSISAGETLAEALTRGIDGERLCNITSAQYKFECDQPLNHEGSCNIQSMDEE
jgi:hypothetical protein